MGAQSRPVLVHTKGGVASIRFNRPDRLNAISQELAQGFAEAVDHVLADPAIQVVIIAGEGRAFMAGADLARFRNSADAAAVAAELIDPTHAALSKLNAASKVTLGSVRGPVAGAGLSIALGLDLVIAAEDTVFNFAYVRVAAPADCGGTWALPRLVGYRRALEIALLSRNVDAAEALRLGLVNHVVPPESLDAETIGLAETLAQGPAVAQGHIKQLMRGSFDRTYGAQLEAEKQAFLDCARSSDFPEAIDAFFAKRAPKFQ